MIIQVYLLSLSILTTTVVDIEYKMRKEVNKMGHLIFGFVLALFAGFLAYVNGWINF